MKHPLIQNVHIPNKIMFSGFTTFVMLGKFYK